MPKFIGSRRALFGGRQYADKLKALFGSSIVGYWPQGEPSGTVSQDIGGRGHNGVYTGVVLGQPGIGDGRTAASFDGATSFDNIYSAGLNTDFNNSAGGFLGWMQVGSAGIWTDGLVHACIQMQTDGSNTVFINKHSVNNQMRLTRKAGASQSNVIATVSALTTWIPVGMSWDTVANQFIAYFGNSQLGTTQTCPGAWVGALASTLCQIGAADTVPSSPWNGKLAHQVLLNRAFTLAEWTSFATVP